MNRPMVPTTVATILLVACVAAPAQAAEQSCILNVDTGVLTCGSGQVVTQRATYVLATLYTAANYGGSSLTLQASSPCDTNADMDHAWSSLPAGIADEVSSFQGANNCQVKLFEHVSYGGLTVGPSTSMSYVGDSMNDRSSSVQLS